MDDGREPQPSIVHRPSSIVRQTSLQPTLSRVGKVGCEHAPGNIIEHPVAVAPDLPGRCAHCSQKCAMLVWH